MEWSSAWLWQGHWLLLKLPGSRWIPELEAYELALARDRIVIGNCLEEPCHLVPWVPEKHTGQRASFIQEAAARIPVLGREHRARRAWPPHQGLSAAKTDPA